MKNLEKEIFELSGTEFNGNISYTQTTNYLSVDYDGSNAVIGYANKAQASRALFLLALCVKNNEQSLYLKQIQRFDTLGVMINASSAIPNITALKQYIRSIAAMGMNMLMLYLEDCFKMDKYPYFGHQRNSYTAEDLKEIDSYAKTMGVEVIASIQTLGHMGRYLCWDEANDIKNSPSTLLVDNEKTYEFIEEQVKTMRLSLSSNRIHVGMDEAKDLALFKHMSEYGYEDPFEVFNRHIGRVNEICKKYDFKPIIWSDMYFSLDKNCRYDYDENVNVPPEVVDKMLDVGMTFWDYYHDYKSFYDINILKHQSFGKEVYFAGGSWDFDGFAPNFAYTAKTMLPALDACLDRGVKHVFSTLWGNGETSYMDSLIMLPVFTEQCYLGKECTMDDIYRMSEAITHADRELIDTISDFHLGLDGWASATRRLLYSDTLINLTHYEFDYNVACEKYAHILGVIKKQQKLKKYDELLLEYYEYLAKICLAKSEIRLKLQSAYKANDRTYLKEVAGKLLPELKSDYSVFMDLLIKKWSRYNRIQNLDAVSSDLGAAMYRVEYAVNTINEYLDGKLSSIPELEIERIAGTRLLYKFPHRYTRAQEY